MKKGNTFDFKRKLLALLFLCSFSAVAEETSMEKVDASVSTAGNAVKKTVRDVKDKTCELQNGKMHCVGKKLKHKAQNISEDASQKINEVKNKVD